MELLGALNMHVNFLISSGALQATPHSDVISTVAVQTTDVVPPKRAGAKPASASRLDMRQL